MSKNYERIEAVLTHIRKRTNTLAKELGFSNGTVFYQIKSGRNGISANLARKICDAYPEIDYSWLLTGNGDMLKKDELKNHASIIELQEQIVFLKNHIKGLDARIELLEQKLNATQRQS